MDMVFSTGPLHHQPKIEFGTMDHGHAAWTIPSTTSNADKNNNNSKEHSTTIE